MKHERRHDRTIRHGIMPALSASNCDSGQMTSIQPELWVDRAGQAVAFYTAAFGARLLHRVGDGDDIVTQLAVGEAAFWVAAADPDAGRFSPQAIGGATSRTLLVTDDPDATVRRAVEAGATETSSPRHEHGWRLGRIIDPFGHKWEIGKPIGPWPPDLTTAD
jgi:PhnB protein